MLFQPGHQGQVVGQAAEQGHGRVAVGVDQTGGEQMARQFAHFVGRVLERFGTRCDQGDTAIADAQSVVTQHHPGRLDRHQPGRQEQQVERRALVGHGVISG
ncbi:hypothetical protein D3C84_953150 [compost metagenome]